MRNRHLKTLGNSRIAHGLVGAVLAPPVALAALLAAASITNPLFGWSHGSASGSGGPDTTQAEILFMNLRTQVSSTVQNGLFWVITSTVVALVGIGLYRVRCWLTSQTIDGRGVVAYGTTAAAAPLLTLGLLLIVVQFLVRFPIVEPYWINTTATLITLAVAGLVVGSASLSIERWLHRSPVNTIAV